MKTPIVQFGTSRFLQAHADLFISEALAVGQAVGLITVVQTTGAAERSARLPALADPNGFPVRIRGLVDGVPQDSEVRVRSVVRALSTAANWDSVVRVCVEEAEILISNTGDAGYQIPADDLSNVPSKSFPGKLLLLLRARFEAGGRALTILPCELVPRNGEVLSRLMAELARARYPADTGFHNWLSNAIVWANSLVDRIVSEPIEPAGAIAEPYALWAIEAQPGLAVPCRHPAVKVVADLTPYEKLKLHILNLGHTVLADIWLAEQRDAGETVRELLTDARIRGILLSIYEEEVIPAFARMGLGTEAKNYVAETLERFDNPFLNHRLSDIAGNHAEKIRRRIGGLRAWSGATSTPQLSAIEQRNGQ
ncbi:tagaturonate reductase [Rhizobium sp. RU20A]|uniref:mannitol dehydrogenase family protein n=1 Tax=Rhizobium sp. RU20A TaxID=1907412 RepID=UPI000953EFED|nr:mannitol dehydrogenase family protein [Rhizobium sp. RU20A]SIQ84104.1 tagaturonate reductase [Rhizobium sp. RU20A]